MRPKIIILKQDIQTNQICPSCKESNLVWVEQLQDPNRPNTHMSICSDPSCRQTVISVPDFKSNSTATERIAAVHINL